jgi:hypothetical protein
VEETVQPNNNSSNVTPWAQQETVLRELLGNSMHFIPTKLNEEVKPLGVEVQTHTEERVGVEKDQAPWPATETVEEVHTQSQEENKEEIGVEGLDEERSRSGTQSSQENLVPGDKYPKALSWITEFKGI